MQNEIDSFDPKLVIAKQKEYQIEQLALEAGFSEDEFDERPLSFISALIEITQILKIETIKDLLFILNKNKQKYKEYFESIFSKSTTAYWTGTQAFYVGLALIFEFDINQLKYYLKNNHSWDKSMLERVIDSVIDIKNYR